MRPENQSTRNYELRQDEVWKPHRPAWNDPYLNFQLIRTMPAVGKDGGEKAKTNVQRSTSNVQRRIAEAGSPDVGTAVQSARGRFSLHKAPVQARY